jgi:predicted Rossmann fold nucleotide-binding protein DprA/Smf involved in DNA uptake
MAGKLLGAMGRLMGFSTLRSPDWNRIACLQPLRRRFHARQPLSAAAKELARARAAGIRLLTCDEPGYPQRLREIYDPPLLLYVRGNIELLNRHQISVVGSRPPPPHRNQMAERPAKDWPIAGS